MDSCYQLFSNKLCFNVWIQSFILYTVCYSILQIPPIAYHISRFSKARLKLSLTHFKFCLTLIFYLVNVRLKAHRKSPVIGKLIFIIHRCIFSKNYFKFRRKNIKWWSAITLCATSYVWRNLFISIRSSS